MNSYTFPRVEIPPREPGEEFSRVDLIFYGIDHSGNSYDARVFVNNGAADVATPRDSSHGYVGSFTVFGHGGCYGDVGHCDVVPRTDPFDRRPPHPLTPWTKTVILPVEAASALTDSDVSVTVVAVEPGADGPVASEALVVERVRLAAYVQ